MALLVHNRGKCLTSQETAKEFSTVDIPLSPSQPLMTEPSVQPLLICDAFSTGTWFSQFPLNGDKVVLG